MSAELSDGRAASNTLEVVTASRGDDGLAIARTRGFDVAIVDVKLPDASGVDLIADLRRASPFGESLLINRVRVNGRRHSRIALRGVRLRPEVVSGRGAGSTIEQALTKVQLARERDELERRYRALVELTDVLVVGLDADDRVALFNRRASMFAAWSRARRWAAGLSRAGFPARIARACERRLRSRGADGRRKWKTGFVDRTGRRRVTGTCRWARTRETMRRSCTASAST